MKVICGLDVHEDSVYLCINFVMVTPRLQLTILTDGYGSQFEYKLEEESIII